MIRCQKIPSAEYKQLGYRLDSFLLSWISASQMLDLSSQMFFFSPKEEKLYVWLSDLLFDYFIFNLFCIY